MCISSESSHKVNPVPTDKRNEFYWLCPSKSLFWPIKMWPSRLHQIGERTIHWTQPSTVSHSYFSEIYVKINVKDMCLMCDWHLQFFFISSIIELSKSGATVNTLRDDFSLPWITKLKYNLLCVLTSFGNSPVRSQNQYASTTGPFPTNLTTKEKLRRL